MGPSSVPYLQQRGRIFRYSVPPRYALSVQFFQSPIDSELQAYFPGTTHVVSISNHLNWHMLVPMDLRVNKNGTPHVLSLRWVDDYIYQHRHE